MEMYPSYGQALHSVGGLARFFTCYIITCGMVEGTISLKCGKTTIHFWRSICCKYKNCKVSQQLVVEDYLIWVFVVLELSEDHYGPMLDPLDKGFHCLIGLIGSLLYASQFIILHTYSLVRCFWLKGPWCFDQHNCEVVYFSLRWQISCFLVINWFVL